MLLFSYLPPELLEFILSFLQDFTAVKFIHEFQIFDQVLEYQELNYIEIASAPPSYYEWIVLEIEIPVNRKILIEEILKVDNARLLNRLHLSPLENKEYRTPNLAIHFNSYKCIWVLANLYLSYGLQFQKNMHLWKDYGWDWRMCLADAAYNGNLKLFKWIFKKQIGYLLSGTIFCFAAHSGNLKLVKYLHKKKCPIDANATLYAARSGNLSIVQYLIEDLKATVFKGPLLARAVKSDKIELVQYLLDRGFELTSDYYRFANSIQMIKFLFNKNLTPIPQILTIGCNNGDLDIVQFAHRHNIVIEYFHIHIAIEKNHTAVSQFLIENKI